MLQPKQEEKEIEQQEGRHGKRHKGDSTYYIDLKKEEIQAGEWEVDGRKKEYHEPVVKDKEENPIREESNKEHEGLSVEPRETNVEPCGDDEHVKFSWNQASMKMWVSKMLLRPSKWK